MKLALTLLGALCIALTATTTAQVYGPSVLAGPPSGQFFLDIVLGSEAQKLLLTPGFPVDLQQRVYDTMSTAELGFAQCSAVPAMPWLQIRCTMAQLQLSKAELKAIDDEAKARAAAAATTTQAPATTIL